MKIEAFIDAIVEDFRFSTCAVATFDKLEDVDLKKPLKYTFSLKKAELRSDICFSALTKEDEVDSFRIQATRCLKAPHFILVNLYKKKIYSNLLHSKVEPEVDRNIQKFFKKLIKNARPYRFKTCSKKQLSLYLKKITPKMDENLHRIKEHHSVDSLKYSLGNLL